MLREAQANPFRRDEGATLYTPPLPQWVLASLDSSDDPSSTAFAKRSSVAWGAADSVGRPGAAESTSCLADSSFDALEQL